MCTRFVKKNWDPTSLPLMDILGDLWVDDHPGYYGVTPL